MTDRVEHEGISPITGEDLGGNVEEVGKAPEKHEEIKGYIEQVETAGEQQQAPTDDQGQPLVQQVPDPTTAVQPDPQIPDDAVILPMTQQQFELGIHEQLWQSARWLAEWCGYIIKKYGGKVFFKG